MLKTSWLNNLRAQSFIVVLCLGLLLAAVFIFYALPEQARWVNNDLSKAAKRSLQQLSASITSPLLTQQYAQLYENIDSQLAIHPNWQAMKITDAVTDLQLYPLDSWPQFNHPDDKVIKHTVLFLNKPLANIELVVNFKTEIAESSKLHYTLIYSQFFILFIVFSGVAFLVDRRITKPLKELEVAFKRLAKDDFECQLPYMPSNEVGSVISAFNNMVEEVYINHNNLNSLRVKAESASRAKSDFMASMSHELRTPLNAILGLAQIYDYDPEATDTHKKNAKSIYQAGEHLLLLIDDVLDLTSIESGNMQFIFEYLPLKGILSESVKLVSELVKVNQVKIFIDDTSVADDVYLYIDRRRFKQVMLNLLSNAIKYNKPQGRIIVSCKIDKNSRCEIKVEDTGYGFSEAAKERLFKPFDRLGAETSNINGTGIGLVITKQLVEHMEGEISAESEVGVGSEFSLMFTTFIRQQETLDEPNQAIHRKVENEILVQSTLKVLIAEDQITNQQVLKQQLNILDIEPTFASDGEQAWEILKKEAFDILLTDIQMPKLNGLELAKRIRAQKQFNNLIIIAITANIIQENVHACEKAGMNDFITKPIELNKLSELLNKYARMTNESSKLSSQELEFNELEQLDLELLQAMLGDDTAIHCLVFEAYLKSVSEQVKLILKHKKSLNYKELAFQAHGLKSSSKSIAAINLANICEKIEGDAEKELCDEATFNQFELCLNEVITQIQGYCFKYKN